MSRQSHKALERLKHIASMGESEAKQYLRNEKGGEPAEDSAGSLERVVLRQRRCQWLTELKGWKDCGEVATHVRVDCGLCYCRPHASMLMRFVALEPLPQNVEASEPPTRDVNRDSGTKSPNGGSLR